MKVQRLWPQSKLQLHILDVPIWTFARIQEIFERLKPKGEFYVDNLGEAFQLYDSVGSS